MTGFHKFFVLEKFRKNVAFVTFKIKHSILFQVIWNGFLFRNLYCFMLQKNLNLIKLFWNLWKKNALIPQNRFSWGSGSGKSLSVWLCFVLFCDNQNVWIPAKFPRARKRFLAQLYIEIKTGQDGSITAVFQLKIGFSMEQHFLFLKSVFPGKMLFCFGIPSFPPHLPPLNTHKDFGCEWNIFKWKWKS